MNINLASRLASRLPITDQPHPCNLRTSQAVMNESQLLVLWSQIRNTYHVCHKSTSKAGRRRRSTKRMYRSVVLLFFAYLYLIRFVDCCQHICKNIFLAGSRAALAVVSGCFPRPPAAIRASCKCVKVNVVRNHEVHGRHIQVVFCVAEAVCALVVVAPVDLCEAVVT